MLSNNETFFETKKDRYARPYLFFFPSLFLPSRHMCCLFSRSAFLSSASRVLIAQRFFFFPAIICHSKKRWKREFFDKKIDYCDLFSRFLPVTLQTRAVKKYCVKMECSASKAWTIKWFRSDKYWLRSNGEILLSAPVLPPPVWLVPLPRVLIFRCKHSKTRS